MMGTTRFRALNWKPRGTDVDVLSDEGAEGATIEAIA